MSKSHCEGLTLLEILIALFLAALSLSLLVGDFGTSRDKLEALADDLERAMRFCSDEAAFTNSVIRLNFLTNLSP
ncbi:MAG: prepilin-type N-terminal cleavage/methylation domain-containing protein, partial [Halobacteriovoraceae bacterium]|nr:prepilin-type N-terminal cleavage/methylation domain-containing protein [Halobacteriovoraceae bacterium]